jgi:hypothetical protein
MSALALRLGATARQAGILAQDRVLAHLVSIYTAGPLEPLKIDMELKNPRDMEKAMSPAKAYK